MECSFCGREFSGKDIKEYELVPRRSDGSSRGKRELCFMCCQIIAPDYEEGRVELSNLSLIKDVVRIAHIVLERLNNRA